MKIADGLKIIENGWIRKPEGFRVRFHQRTESGFAVGYSPPPEDAPLTSDVTAWRYAWKLWQATRNEAQSGETGGLYNIVVVNTENESIPFYASGKPETFNPLAIDPDDHADGQAP